MAKGSVQSEMCEGVALAALDDGKANAIGFDVVAALHAHLDLAEREAAPTLITGRPGMLSGGFDLAVMRGGPDDVHRLVTAGAELFVRFLEFPHPIVVAATGHAIAAGAILLLAADARIGASGAFKIGLSEVASGMTLPAFAIELARNRLSKRHFHRATNQAALYSPEAAVDVGYLDQVEAPDRVVAVARAEAERLGSLAQPAFGATKQRLNRSLVSSVRETLEADLAALIGRAR